MSKPKIPGGKTNQRRAPHKVCQGSTGRAQGALAVMEEAKHKDEVETTH